MALCFILMALMAVCFFSSLLVSWLEDDRDNVIDLDLARSIKAHPSNVVPLDAWKSGSNVRPIRERVR